MKTISVLLLILAAVTGCSALGTAPAAGPPAPVPPPPRGSPLPVPPPRSSFPSSSSSVRIDPLELAWLRLAQSTQGKPGNLPGGCATLVRQRICVPRVMVDGRHLSDVSLLGAIVGATLNRQPHLPLHSQIALREGVAEVVFQQLLFLEALRDGIRVTEAQAQAVAEQELRVYEQHPPRPNQRFVVPVGMTARQYFLSPRSIAGYRDGLIVGRERERILRAHPMMLEDRAFRLWFRDRLPHYTVTINGSPPTFSLAAAWI